MPMPLSQDLRYAWRYLLKSPAYTATLLLTLALGVGATTAIFSVVNAVLLRPLPYRDPESLVQVAETTERFPRFAVAPANFLDWREQNTVFEDMAAIKASTANLTGNGEPERLTGRRVSASFFSILGVEPTLGRAFLPEEDRADGDPVVILGHALWRRRFGSDPAILGRTITLEGTPHTVIGVMPASFRYFTSYWSPEDVEIWFAYPFVRDPPAERAAKRLQAIARLKPGVSVATAQQQMDAVAQGLEEAYPDTNEGWGVVVASYQAELVKLVRPYLLILLGAVGFVLLISCVNVSNLLLAAAFGREREMAVRMALGAGRGRLVRQLLTESLVIGVVGSGMGLLLAWSAIGPLTALAPHGVPRLDETRVDGNVLLVTMGLALLTALAFGVAPAVRGSNTSLTTALKEGSGRTTEGSGRLRGRNLLIVTEIALTLILLAGAGLMLNSLVRLQQVDPGFPTDALLLTDVYLPRSKYAEASGQGTRQYTKRFIRWVVRPEQIGFVEEVVARIDALPEVISAAAVNYAPVTGSNWGQGFTIEGRPPPGPDEFWGAFMKAMTPGYLETMGIPLLLGRRFTATDAEGSPDVLLINETLADEYFAGENPLGERIRFRDGSEDQERSFEIVGVVGNVRQQGLDFLEPERIMYIPYRQQAEAYVDWQVAFRMRMTFVARTRGDPSQIVPTVRRAVWAVDPDQPITNVRTMGQVISESLSERRYYGLLLGIFAGVAVVMAAMGVYGLMAYTVGRRIHEIGIRMALGAGRRRVVRMMLRRGLFLAGAGVFVGLGGAVALTRVIASQLYGVSPTDPPTLAVIAVLLLGIAGMATYVPARRAARVDPMESLRYE